jgi:hypothetical protein
VGGSVGGAVGASVGESVGGVVGSSVGSMVGAAVGVLVGSTVEPTVGSVGVLGTSCGAAVGNVKIIMIMSAMLPITLTLADKNFLRNSCHFLTGASKNAEKMAGMHEKLPKVPIAIIARKPTIIHKTVFLMNFIISLLWVISTTNGIYPESRRSFGGIFCF